MKLVVRAGATLFALSLVLVACGDDDGGGNGDGGSTGGGGGDALSEEEFVEEANSICAAGNEELAEAGQELDDDASEEDIVAFVEDELIPSIQGQIDDIRDLAGPEDFEADVDTALDDAEAALADIADDPEGFINSNDDPFADVNEQLVDLGITECADTEGDSGEGETTE